MTITKVEDRRVRLDSLRTLRYLQAGRRSASRSVIYLPPLGVTADFWAPNLLSMAQTGRVAFAIDIPGYGASSPPHSANMNYFSHVVLEFIQAMQLERVTLVGNSLGATLALGLYLQAPRLINALVLVDAFGLGSNLPAGPWNLWNIALPSFWLGVFGRGDWAYWRTLRGVFSSLPDDVEQRFQVGSGSNWTRHTLQRWSVILALTRRLGLPIQRRHFLRAIQAQVERVPLPILTLWGEHDRMLPVRHTCEIQSALPQSEIYIFPDTGHHPPAENPEEFDRRLIDFLDRHTL